MNGVEYVGSSFVGKKYVAGVKGFISILGQILKLEFPFACQMNSFKPTHRKSIKYGKRLTLKFNIFLF